MTFNLSTTGNWYDKECKEKLESLGFKFSLQEEPNYRAGDFRKDDEQELTIEMNSLEALMRFVDEWGNVVVGKDFFSKQPGLEIYDDYRE